MSRHGRLVLTSLGGHLSDQRLRLQGGAPRVTRGRRSVKLECLPQGNTATSKRAIVLRFNVQRCGCKRLERLLPRFWLGMWIELGNRARMGERLHGLVNRRIVTSRDPRKPRLIDRNLIHSAFCISFSFQSLCLCCFLGGQHGRHDFSVLARALSLDCSPF